MQKPRYLVSEGNDIKRLNGTPLILKRGILSSWQNGQAWKTCGGLNENGPLKLIGSGTSKRCGLGLGVASLEEVSLGMCFEI